jgi:dienelactone hydrolase
MKRVISLCLAVLSLTALVAGPARASSGGWIEARHQFDYRRAAISVTELAASRRPGAVVHDIVYRAPGQDPVSAYLVTPARSGRHPAAMFLHWLDNSPDANRTEFLDEALDLAAGRDHVVSLLPQLVFPFDYGPVGDGRDRDSIIKQVIQLRRGVDLLDARADVDRGRVAVVGHDYGAMYAALLSAVDRNRVAAAVIMAADSTWANWFVLFFLDLPADQVAPYTAMLSSLDPIRYLAHAPAHTLLQYATDDFFIPISVAEAMHAAAPPTSSYRTYQVDHSLQLPLARHQRDHFLTRALH